MPHLFGHTHTAAAVLCIAEMMKWKAIAEIFCWLPYNGTSTWLLIHNLW